MYYICYNFVIITIHCTKVRQHNIYLQIIRFIYFHYLMVNYRQKEIKKTKPEYMTKRMLYIYKRIVHCVSDLIFITEVDRFNRYARFKL